MIVQREIPRPEVPHHHFFRPAVWRIVRSYQLSDLILCENFLLNEARGFFLKVE